MAILVILVLGILWAAVLVPPILRSRNDAGAGLGISDVFGRLREGLGHRGHGGDPSLPPLQPIMGPIGSMGPMGPIGGPPGPMGAQFAPGRAQSTMTPLQRRRRDILVGLLGFAGLLFMIALVKPVMMIWVVQLLADAAVIGYVFLLLQFKARAHGGAERERRPAQPRFQPAPLVPAMPNVHDLTARRFPPATSVAQVEPPREATVLALRRSASW